MSDSVDDGLIDKTSVFYCVNIIYIVIILHFSGLSELTRGYLNPGNFKIVCEENTLNVTSYNVRECNFGRVPARMVSTELYYDTVDIYSGTLVLDCLVGRPTCYST